MLDRILLSHRVVMSLLLATAALVAAGCGDSKSPAAPPKPEVQVVGVVAKDVAIYEEWVGSTVGMINATIRPKIEGYLLSQEYEDGSQVAKGDLLFRIDPRQFKAQLDAAIAQLNVEKAILEKADIHVRRYTPLATKGAVSAQELDDALQAQAAGRAQVAAAQAEVEQARLNLQWTQIHAPVDGISGIATIQVGDLVNSTDLLTTISQVDPIKVNFPVSEIQYLRFAQHHEEKAIDPDMDPSREIELILADGSTYSHKGKVTVTGRAVSEDTGTIIVQGIFPNPKRLLRPGQFAKVRGRTELRKGALVIPQRAVKQSQGIDQVAVVDADDTVRFVHVELGPRTGEDWIVAKGLDAGQKVIVQGLQKVRPGMVVDPKTAKDDPKKVETPKGKPTKAKPAKDEPTQKASSKSSSKLATTAPHPPSAGAAAANGKSTVRGA